MARTKLLYICMVPWPNTRRSVWQPSNRRCHSRVPCPTGGADDRRGNAVPCAAFSPVRPCGVVVPGRRRRGFEKQSRDRDHNRINTNLPAPLFRLIRLIYRCIEEPLVTDRYDEVPVPHTGTCLFASIPTSENSPAQLAVVRKDPTLDSQGPRSFKAYLSQHMDKRVAGENARRGW